VPSNPKDYNRNSVIAKHDKSQPVTRKDVITSAERIYYRYIVPSAEKELHDVPKDILDRVKHMLESEGRMDPGVFKETKTFVFNIMETQHFPKFLRYKVWSNTTWKQSILRLILGLVSLFFGFAVELSLIFLNYGSPYTRIWGVIPLFFGVLNLLVALTQLDPIWVLVFGISETTTFKFNKIRQSIVRKILYPRAAWLLGLTLFFSALLTVIFCVVPSGILYAP
jgi:predicted RND superfamily exporter protein